MDISSRWCVVVWDECVALRRLFAAKKIVLGLGLGLSSATARKVVASLFRMLLVVSC